MGDFKKDMLVAELESVKCLLDSKKPLNANHLLKELIEKNPSLRPELMEIRDMLYRFNPPKVEGGSYRIHILIRRLVNGT